MLCVSWDPFLQTLIHVPMGGLGWPAKAAQGLAVKHMYKSLWNWSVVQSGPDPDFNQAAGKTSRFSRAEALGRWRGFAPLKHFCCPRNLTNGRMGHALVQFPFLPSPSSQVAAESTVGSGQCWCEKQGEWTYHQSGGSNFLFSGFSNPPTPPNPVIHSKMRICWCRYAYVHTHPQAEVSVCTQRSYVCIFFYVYAYMSTWFPVLRTALLCAHREIPNALHTSTPEFNFFYIDDLASDVLPLLIGSFLVALYLVGIFFDVNLIWEAY